MSWADDIHSYTNGRFSVGPQDGVENTFIENVGSAATQIATKDFRTEENTVYDNYKRLDRVAAVSSVLMANSSAVLNADKYEEAMGAVSSSYLAKIGYSDNGNAEKSILNGQIFAYKDSSGVMQTITTSGLDDSQLRSLSINGTCKINGFTCTVNGMSRTDAMQHASSAIEGQKHTEHISGSLSRRDKNVELSRMRSDSLNYIKSLPDPTGVIKNTLKNGNENEIKSCLNQINNEISNVRAQITANPKDTSLRKTLNDLIEQQNALTEHNGMLGGGTSSGLGMTRHQRYGLNIIASNMVGSDMMFAYRTYKAETQIVTGAVRVAYKGGAKIGGAIANRGLQAANTFIPQSRLTQKLNQIANSAQERQNRRQNYREKVRNGQRKEAKQELKQFRKERKNLRSVRKEERLKCKLKKQQAKGHTKRAVITNGRIRLHQGTQTIRKFEAGLKSKILKPFTATKNFFSNMWQRSIFGRMTKGIHSATAFVREKLNIVMAQVKKILLKYLAIPVIAFLLIAILITGLADIMVMVSALFLSEEEDNTNYTQKIVDEIAQTMSKDYLKLAKKDAEKHYASIDNAPKSGYSKDGVFTGTTINGGNEIDWHKAPTAGSIGDITNWDGTKKLSSINANLLPITSLMHYRFSTVIDEDNYLTAKAYMYYMYVLSHDIVGYDYKDIDDCAPENIYAGTITAENWDVSKKTLSRPDEICANIYLHGYPIETTNTKLTEIANKAMKAAYKIAHAIAPYEVVDKVLGKTQGIWVDEKPYDTINGVNVECKNYVASVYSVTEYSTGPNWYDWYTELLCGQVPHIHDASCYKLDCDIEDTPCTMPGDCNAGVGEPGYHICNGSTHTHKDGPPADYMSLVDDDYNECWKRTCDIPAHSHTAWFEPYDDAEGHHESCYSTVYICKGHCGGHVQPIINLKVDTNWDSLMRRDNLNIPNFVTSSQFYDGFVANIFQICSDLSGYQNEWNKKVTKWFTFNVHSGVSSKDEESADEDVNGFYGWIDEDTGTTDTMVAELESIYGTEETDFEEGVKNWEEVGEVVFPLGAGRPLSEIEIDSFMEELLASNPGLSANRQAAIQKAMEYVGMFWYDLQNPGTMMDESGRIDCSGFISSVLYHAEIGFANDWTASGYSSHGFARPGSMIPGDILSKNTNYYAGSWSGDGKSNHVIMYIGHLSDGPDGDGEYIIDCSSSQGGSCLRKMKDFSGYNYCYRGCY